MQQPIFRGATRPAMALGVPMMPAVATAGITILAVMWTRRPEFIFVFLVFFVWMRLVSSKDDYYLLQMLQRTSLTSVVPASKRRLNGVESYRAFDYKQKS